MVDMLKLINESNNNQNSMNNVSDPRFPIIIARDTFYNTFCRTIY